MRLNIVVIIQLQRSLFGTTFSANVVSISDSES